MQQLHLLPYFEAKSQVNQQLEWQKQRVRRLESQVGEAKGTYAAALDALETISDQIHKSRQSKLELGVRGVGVGAESPSPRLPSEHNSSPHTEEASASTSSAAIDKGTSSGAVPASTAGQDATRTVKADDLSAKTAAVEEPVIVAYSASALQASCEGLNNSSTEAAPSTECKGPSEQQQLCGSGSSSLGGDLSGWQLVGAEASSGSTAGGAGSLALTVEDASMSDSESLASMEMLSDEAIAGLMLEDELSGAAQPATGEAQEAGRSSHARTIPLADTTASATTAAVDGTDFLGQLSRSYSEAPLTEDRSSSSVVLGQSAPSCGLLSSACQQSGTTLSSTNPFTSTNPFLSGETAAPFASSEELLSKIDSVIRSTKPDMDDSLDSNPFTAAKAVVIVETANAGLSTNITDARKSLVDGRVPPPPSDSETRLPDSTVSSTDALSSSFTVLSSSDKPSVSPSRSPVNRPSSLPLTSLNNPAGRSLPPPAPSTSFVPVVSSTSASSHRPEPVVVASDSSSGSSAGHHSSTSDAEGVTRSSSAVSTGPWSPEFSTPAYAPLHDALESPTLGPPPDYPPPLYPPPPPRRLLRSGTPSPE